MASIETLGHLINFTVDKETCIGCRACAEGFPDQFVMNDDENKAYVTGVPAGDIDIYEPVIACPVDSISIVDFKGRLLLNPQQARDKKPVEEAAVAQIAADFEALPPEQKKLIEVKPKAAPAKAAPGELSEQWLAQLGPQQVAHEAPPPRFRPGVWRALAWTQPIWGAFSDRWKNRVMELSGDPSALSPGTATTLNALINFFLYPAVVWGLGRMLVDAGLLGEGALTGLVLILGVGYSFVEFAFRLKDEIFEWGIVERDRVYPGAIYMLPFGGAMVRSLERLAASPSGRELLYGEAAIQGDGDWEAERAKLYGRALRATKLADGSVQLELDFASRLRLSSGEVLDLPDYVYDVATRDSRLVLRAWIADPQIEARWSFRDPVPLSFEREIAFPMPVESFEEERTGRKLRVRVTLQAAKAA